MASMTRPTCSLPTTEYKMCLGAPSKHPVASILVASCLVISRILPYTASGISVIMSRVSLLVSLEKKLYYLSASVLIYYGVQRLVKSEKYSCRSEDDHIAQEDIIPGIYPFLLRKIYGYEIRTSAACAVYKAYAYGRASQNTSEYAYQERIVGYGHRRKDIGEYAGEKKRRKKEYIVNLEPIYLKPIYAGDKIERKIYGGISYLKSEVSLRHLLKQDSQPAESAGKQTACLNEAFQIESYYR